jgi:hypothetical protein
MRVRRMTLLPPPRPPPLPLPLSLARTICESEIVINERVKCLQVVHLQVKNKKSHQSILLLPLKCPASYYHYIL